MRKFITIATTTLLFTGCASVPTVNSQLTETVKQFKQPVKDRAGLYIYRTGGLGGAVKKDVKINGNCIGETAPNVFFYEEVIGNQEYTISTESEFSPNELKFFAKGGENYFIKQYLKPGLVVAGANLKIVEDEEGQQAVKKLKQAEKGTCGQ
ncbi:DUF2846 domain-containing protein [Acinetobacter seifertii]|uniref:DUF2846 domain-containing protein n=1 Tax=Acinetobacter seifertii TaxID=1530123 RepID=UPI000D3B8E89|nr:DUF2846 domain-containing protein [Acinetobacter seifertii]PTV52125.1 hypothetical protein DBL04_15210 [Acinetobacter seifertii]